VGAVDLHAVEAGDLGPNGRLGERGDDLLSLSPFVSSRGISPPGAGIADGATGSAPANGRLAIRPPCNNCSTAAAPPSWITRARSARPGTYDHELGTRGDLIAPAPASNQPEHRYSIRVDRPTQ